MYSFDHLYDASAVSTPSGMTPTVAASGVTHVPSVGTGLSGEVFINNSSIWNTTRLKEVIATTPPIMTFTASEISYAGNRSDTTVAEFLDHDAGSIQGANGNAFEMGPSGLKMTGFVYIPPGARNRDFVG